MVRLVVGPVVALFFLLSLVAAPGGQRVSAAADTLPDRLTDEEFWALSQQMSEPNGYFRSENLLSNEIYYPYIMTDLVQRTRSGGVYLGVGPEQNFNYIAAIRPKMVIITDIRRGNLYTHLMYKALFELSADRAEFFGRLFTKKRPASLGASSTAGQLMTTYWDVVTEPEDVYKANLKAIGDHLTKTRKFPLTADDLAGIEFVYYHFYWFGPSITYNSSAMSPGRTGGGNMTDYASLMAAVDENDVPRSFLASEENFRAIKDLEERNLIVPVVGNFGGPKALRAVGDYVRRHGATVSAFYLSNVEQYLRQDGIWYAFCANVATMPLDEQSTFIRSGQGFGGGGGGGLRNSLGSMLAETRGCTAEATGQSR